MSDLVAIPVPAPTSSTRIPASGPSASNTSSGYEGRAASYSSATASNEATRPSLLVGIGGNALPAVGDTRRLYCCAVRLGVISDIHGVASALGAVLDDGAQNGVDRWWALGDLVLFGPHPVEVLEMLTELDDVAFVSGNTDRYVLTDDQPHPHATAADAMADADLVRRYGLMAAGAAWTRGVLDQGGVLEFLDDLPEYQTTQFEDGTRLLGVHASPASDDGYGFDSTSADDEIARLLAGLDTDWVVGGHTHDPTDRFVDGIRVLNPGSVGLPRTIGFASWMVIESKPDRTEVEHRLVEFDVTAVVDALHRRRHPNREFIASVLGRGTFVESH